MANPITNTAAFATANMKPAPDEQIDALWGQNIADNTGYLYFKKVFGPSFHLDGLNQSLTHGTFVFEKAQGHSQFAGSLNGTVQRNTYGSLTLRMNGTIVSQDLWDLSSSSTGTRVKKSFGTSLAGLTDGVFYEFTWAFGVSTSSYGNPFMDITTWQSI